MAPAEALRLAGNRRCRQHVRTSANVAVLREARGSRTATRPRRPPPSSGRASTSRPRTGQRRARRGCSYAAGNIREPSRCSNRRWSTNRQPRTTLLLRDIYLFQGSTAGVPALDTFLDNNTSEEHAGADVDLELGVIEADHGNAAEAVRLGSTQYDTRPENVFTASGLAWALHVAGDDDGPRCPTSIVRCAWELGRGVPIPGRRRVGRQWAGRAAPRRSSRPRSRSIRPSRWPSTPSTSALAADLGVECPVLSGT